MPFRHSAADVSMIASVLRLRARRGGIALVDLALTVLIVGIVAAVATPRFFTSLSAHRSRAAARRIAADLEYARRRAITRSASQTATFSTTTHSYTLAGVADPVRPSTTWTVRLSEAPWESTIASITFGNSGVLVFDWNGRPDRAGSLVVQSGGSQSTVAVDALTGKVSVP